MKKRTQESSAVVGRVTPCAPVFADGHHEQTARRGLTRPTSTALLLTCFFILHSSFCLPALGQSFSLDWYKISGGGGTSSGGPVTGINYSISGTIGQPDASGSMHGGNYSVTGGFWSLYAVQTPGAPLLVITVVGNQAVVSWDPSVTGWTLQTNANLATPAWGSYLGVVVSNSVTNAPVKGNLFFRLKQ
jgi:hypothetical protein